MIQSSAAKTKRRRTEIVSSLTSNGIQDKELEEAADLDPEKAVVSADSDGNLPGFSQAAWRMHRFKYQTQFFNKTEYSKYYEQLVFFSLCARHATKDSEQKRKGGAPAFSGA